MPAIVTVLICAAAAAAVLTAVLLFVFTATESIDDATRQRLKPFIGRSFAHKGLYLKDQSVPENSLPAFSAALVRGYGIDCDVQRTWDGQAVCFCDTHMRVACGIDERMVSFNYEHLRMLKLFGTEEHMPLLSDALELVAGRVPMVIEVKSPAGLQGVAPTCESIYAVLKDYDGPYCVASFDPHILNWFRKNAPEVLRMQASMAYFEWRETERSPLRCIFMSRLMCNILSRPHLIAFSLSRRNIGLRVALRKGAPLMLYTNNRKHRHEELMNHCDALVFEDYLPSDK